MEKYQVKKFMLTGWLVVLPLAGCENLPGTPEQQGAVAGGAAGVLAGSSLGDSTFDTLLGGALGAGAGYLIGANSDRLFGADEDDREDAREAISSAQADPATIEDVNNSTTADLNNDGFVTADELVAMSDAGLSDAEIIDRLDATNQVFELTPSQENELARQGVSRNVLVAMEDINQTERQQLFGSSGNVISSDPN